MLKNTIKLAFRTMRRQKIYSFINILGLAIGLTCCILLLLWIQDESGYDRFHEHSDRIYRVTIKDKIGGSDQNFAVTPIAMAPVIKTEIPEILYAARISTRSMRFLHEDNGILEKGLLISPDFCRRLPLDSGGTWSCDLDRADTNPAVLGWI